MKKIFDMCVCKNCNKSIIKVIDHYNKCCADLYSPYEYCCMIYEQNIMDDIIFLYKAGHSLNELKTLYNIPRKVLEWMFKSISINLRSISESTKTDVVQKNKRSTCELKYGCGIINVSQSPEIKKKKAQTFMEHYGVDNIRKYQKYYEYVNNVCLERYGKFRVSGFNNKTEEEKNKILNKMKLTSINKYGVPHYTQSVEFKEYIKDFNSSLSDEEKQRRANKFKESYYSKSELELQEIQKKRFNILLKTAKNLNLYQI